MKERTIKKKDISEVRERELLPAPSRSLFQVLPSAVTHFFVDLPCLSPFPPPPPPPQLRVEIRELKSELTGTRAAMLEKARKRTPSPPSTPKAPFVDIGRFPPPPFVPLLSLPTSSPPLFLPFRTQGAKHKKQHQLEQLEAFLKKRISEEEEEAAAGRGPQEETMFSRLGGGAKPPALPAADLGSSSMALALSTARPPTREEAMRREREIERQGEGAGAGGGGPAPTYPYGGSILA